MPLKKALPVLFFFMAFTPGLRAQNGPPPAVSGKDFAARLAQEVRAQGDILSADYDYAPWHKFQQSNSHRAVHAAADKEAEFASWDQAEKALDDMEKFSNDLKAVQSRPSISKTEFKSFVAELLGAFKPLKLEQDHELLRHYLAQLPPLQGAAGRTASAQAGRDVQAAQAAQQQTLGRMGSLSDAGAAAGAFDASANRQALANRPGGAVDLRAPAAGAPQHGDGAAAEQQRKAELAQAPKAPPEPKLIRVAAGKTDEPRPLSAEEKKTQQEKDFERARTKVIIGAGVAVLAVPVAVVAITGGVAAVGGAVVVAAAAGAMVVGGSLYAWGSSQMPDGGWDKIHDQLRLSAPAKPGPKP